MSAFLSRIRGTKKRVFVCSEDRELKGKQPPWGRGHMEKLPESRGGNPRVRAEVQTLLPT